MKKWISLLLVLTMCLALCACGEKKINIEVSSDPAVLDVMAKINAIGKTTLSSGDAITAAETAYAALTDAQKSEVSNYAVLTGARSTYDRITEVVNLIDQIGTVTAESEEKIILAEQAFDRLPERDRELITNQETLHTARETFDALSKTATLDADLFKYYFEISNTFSVTKTAGAGSYTTKIAGDIQVSPFDAMASVENVTVSIRVHYNVTKDDNGEWLPKPGTKDVTITLAADGTGSAAFSGSYTCTMDYPVFELTDYEILSVSGTVEVA